MDFGVTVKQSNKLNSISLLSMPYLHPPTEVTEMREESPNSRRPLNGSSLNNIIMMRDSKSGMQVLNVHKSFENHKTSGSVKSVSGKDSYSEVVTEHGR
jgi:hypothetical protein